MKLLLTALLGLFSLPAAAHDGVHVIDPFARAFGASGAAYFRIFNAAPVEDVLLSASSPDAGMAMLMESGADATGVMKMDAVPDGFVIAPGGAYVLTGGGAHVMLMGLKRHMKSGDTVTLTLTFRHAGEVPVDNTRTTDPGAVPTPNDAESP
jgi:copper(I)-binding protein